MYIKSVRLQWRLRENQKKSVMFAFRPSEKIFINSINNRREPKAVSL